MSLLSFRIRYPDGRQELLAIDADRALIGSGAHCEIRLPNDAAKIEHVSVQANPNGVYAQALAFDPPPLVNGVPFTQGAILPETILSLGGVEITVSADEVSPEAKVVRRSTQKASPMTLALLALLVPLAGFVLFYDDAPQGMPDPPKKIPELWDAPPASCPQQGAGQALSLANDRLTLAEAKRERSPFDVRDGVSAVPLFELASTCFRVANEGASSNYARDAGGALRGRLAEQYHTHVVWLEHSLRIKDWRSAQHEVSLLLQYTEGRKGEYVTWLTDLERQLRVKYGVRAP